MKRSAPAREQILLMSSSEWLHKRIEAPLNSAGYAVEAAKGVGQLARHERTRPFFLCFIDARGTTGAATVEKCFSVRPSERYVLILSPWQKLQGETDMPNSNGSAFGFLREPFSGPEVMLWAERAFRESRLAKGDYSLEEMLYRRFKSFLQNLGQTASGSVYNFVWESVDRPLIKAVMEWTGGNQSKASEVLGLHRNTLRAKIKNLGMNFSEKDDSLKKN